MKNTFVIVVACSLIAGCSVFGSFGGSAGSSAGGSSGDSSAGSSGGSSAGLFGKKRVKEVELEQRDPTVDKRVLIPTVTKVVVDSHRGGALVHATGTTGNIGYHDLHLAPVNGGFPDEDGVISFEFKGEFPEVAVTPTTERSRELIAGNSISAKRLAGARSIRVIARDNQITVRK